MNLDFAKLGGLIPAIVQDARTGEVLMLGFMNKEAYEATRASGAVTFFSRSRRKLWRKGELSGHTRVCHKGYRSCFFRRLDEDGRDTVIEKRAFDPHVVYGGESRR